MRAAILNGTQPATLNAAEDYFAIAGALTMDTDNPAQAGNEVTLPSERKPSFDVETMTQWVNTGAEIQKAGKIATGGLDFAALAGAIGAGAAVGSAIPLLGTVAGAVVGAVFYLAQWLAEGQVPADWVNAAPGVHEWFTAYGPQGFLDWVRDTRPELLGSNPQELTRALLLYWLERDGVVITDAPGRSHYSGIPDHVYYTMAGGYPALVTLYGQLGIDYPLTRLEAHPAGHTGADGVSQGLGGVWHLKRAMYVAPATATPLPGPGKPDAASSSFATAGAFLLGGWALYKLST